MGLWLDLDVEELKVLIRVKAKTFQAGLRLWKELRSELRAGAARSPKR